MKAKHAELVKTCVDSAGVMETSPQLALCGVTYALSYAARVQSQGDSS